MSSLCLDQGELSRMIARPESARVRVLLTPREKEVLDNISHGMTTQEIAMRMILSPHTIFTYRKHLLEKLEAENTANMIRIAFELGLLKIESISVKK